MKTIIAANWKMNLDMDEVKNLVGSIKHTDTTNDADVILCPSFCYLDTVRTLCETHQLNAAICAQNISEFKNGAYTGDISANMVKSCGATHVLLGHSERRHCFNESNEMIHRKLERCKSEGLIPILCVGETLEQFESGETTTIIKEQLSVLNQYSGQFIIAYEPVWAIGTGKNATPEQAQSIHEYIRASVGEDIAILYGGSVKKGNVDGLLKMKDINGALIGGASLNSDEFNDIIKISNNLQKEGVV